MPGGAVKLRKGLNYRDEDTKIPSKGPLGERWDGLHILPEAVKDMDAQKGQ